MIEEPGNEKKRLDVPMAMLLVAGFGGAFILGGALLGGMISPLLGLLAGLVTAVTLVVVATDWIRNGWRRVAIKASQVLILVVLPLWGLAYNALAIDTCTVSSCASDTAVFRAFAVPEVYAIVALHAFTVIAYRISRVQPQALRPVGEALVNATLFTGMVAQVMIGVHVGGWILIGFLAAPVFLPCAMPVLTFFLYGAELYGRLRRRGEESGYRPDYRVADSPYREGPLQEPLQGPKGVHLPSALRALAVSPLLLGLYATVNALWLGRPDAAARVFTRTCGHVLSQTAVVVTPADCHYLCTVAARGPAWLVRPIRMGRRRGVPIVVNRQLAIANAFEDLLRERWPRFARFARTVYDRVGLPICRYIRRPWLAATVYVVMKPFEWVFAVTLLCLDRRDPEERIDRMYR